MVSELAVEEQVLSSQCWCCDGTFAPQELTRLGAHPEVGVCRECARFLNRRAATGPTRRGPVVTVRRATSALRNRVISRGWHDRPLVGRILRGADKLLP